jgi:hypothetical protein
MTPPLQAPADALFRIQSEYLEMPDLCLTAPEAERLMALDVDSCRAALDNLVHSRFLARSRSGCYVRMASR